MTSAEHQRIAAAKADKYIGRDGSDPRVVAPNEDVAMLARIVAYLGRSEREAALSALARVSGLPRIAVAHMARGVDDCPF